MSDYQGFDRQILLLAIHGLSGIIYLSGIYGIKTNGIHTPSTYSPLKPWSSRLDLIWFDLFMSWDVFRRTRLVSSKCVVFNACQWCWDGHMTWIDMEFVTPMEGASTCSQQMFTICVPLAVTAGRRYRDIKWYKEKERERWSMLWWVCCRLVPIADR